MNNFPQGYLSLVLHAHLPFVRHPEHPVFLEENWLFEAILESYLPLLRMIRQLRDENIPAPLTISLSPTLCEMLNDELLRNRFSARLENLRELSEKELERTQHQPEFHHTAQMYHQRFAQMQALYENEYQRDLLRAFRDLQDDGHLEIICTAATHAFLPLLGSPRCRRAQLRMGVQNYTKHFGRAPRGIWLPECAFIPGLDEELAALNLRYFFLDSHGIINATPRPRNAFFAPVYCRSMVAAFGRDIESSRQIWSATQGYPGDPAYREFYRDLGYDADENYIRPYLHPDNIRHDIGVKYFRVTGDVPLHEKAPYSPEMAQEQATRHAGDFLQKRIMQSRQLGGYLDNTPLFVAPFDAELFGHWWYEGPDFLEALFRQLHQQQDIMPLTPPAYLEQHHTLQQLTPSASSWGDKGYFEVWLNGANDWLYPQLHKIEHQMCALSARFSSPTPQQERALNQAARELMLLESSDWPFILTTGTVVEYAQRRIADHIARFNELHHMLASGSIDESRLSAIENADNLFSDINFRIYDNTQPL